MESCAAFPWAGQPVRPEHELRAHPTARPGDHKEIVTAVDLEQLRTLRRQAAIRTGNATGIRDDDLVNAARLYAGHVRRKLGKSHLTAAVDHIDAPVFEEE